MSDYAYIIIGLLAGFVVFFIFDTIREEVRQKAQPAAVTPIEKEVAQPASVVSVTQKKTVPLSPLVLEIKAANEQRRQDRQQSLLWQPTGEIPALAMPLQGPQTDQFDLGRVRKELQKHG